MSNFNNKNLRINRMPVNVPQNSHMLPNVVRPGIASGGPPQLPPRPSLQPLNSSYDLGFNNSYPSFGYGGFGGYGGYSPYGHLGSPYRVGLYGSNGMYSNGRSLDDVDSSFIQLAEESSRPAFQSIESIVHTFANVTMMLESTFHAMQTSFRAVIGVAENFNKLRTLSLQIAKYISALTMLRTMYWFFRRILYMLGLLKNHPTSEDVWKASELVTQVKVTDKIPGEVGHHSSWPLITYFALLFGGPYAMYKILSSFKSGDKKEKLKWDPRIHDYFDAVALYNFKAANNTELSVSAGESLKVAPKKYHDSSTLGWTQATNQQKRYGLVPLNYIKLISSKKIVPSLQLEGNAVPVPSSESTNETINPNLLTKEDITADPK